MNHCMLMAKIITAPQLRYTQDNQTAIAEMTVAFPGLRPEDPAQTLKVIGWGNLAQDIQANYHEGYNVLLEGRLSINSIERPEGFKDKQAEMTVQRIVNLTDLQALDDLSAVAVPPVGNSVATAPATYTAPPNTAPAATSAPVASAPDPEVDYDDIPF